MSEHQESGTRTEEPTERKIQDAVEKGNVPFSRDAVTLGSLLAMLLTLKMFAGWSAGGIMLSLAVVLEQSGTVSLPTEEDALTLLTGLAAPVVEFLLPILLALAAGGALAALLQNVPQAATERIRPKFSRISPASGWKRIFGSTAMMEFAKALVKLAAVSAVALVMLKSNSGLLLGALYADPAALPGIILGLVIDLTAAFCVFALALAAFDVAWSRFDWRRGLRMTREELKEEHRQSEGDPHLRARARSIARQRVSSKMFAKLPTATMLITNPTHYAVALRYVHEERGVPVVVAKGVDHLALRIRQAAEGHGIPAVENRPLARSLYEQVEVDDAIPPELYRAVAEVIHFLQMKDAANARSYA